MKMPANSLATSTIGSQAKPLASRCSRCVEHQRERRPGTRMTTIAHQVLQLDRHAAKREARRRAASCADSRMARDDAGEQRQVGQPADAQPRVSGVGSLILGSAVLAAVEADVEREEDGEHQCRRRTASRPADGVVVQKKSTPRRKPTNSGGSPSGVSAPPMFETRKMKKTTTWALNGPVVVGADHRADHDHRRAGGADDGGEQRADGQQEPALTSGVPWMLPATRMPPAIVNSANSRMMKGRYSSSSVCSTRFGRRHGRRTRRPAAATTAPPSRARSCRSDVPRHAGRAAGRWRSTAGGRRRARPTRDPCPRRRSPRTRMPARERQTRRVKGRWVRSAEAGLQRTCFLPPLQAEVPRPGAAVDPWPLRRPR